MSNINYLISNLYLVPPIGSQHMQNNENEFHMVVGHTTAATGHNVLLASNE